MVYLDLASYLINYFLLTAPLACDIFDVVRSPERFSSAQLT
jgi:hypothetical protein